MSKQVCVGRVGIFEASNEQSSVSAANKSRKYAGLEQLILSRRYYDS